jgi:hypothetical protein
MDMASVHAKASAMLDAALYSSTDAARVQAGLGALAHAAGPLMRMIAVHDDSMGKNKVLIEAQADGLLISALGGCADELEGVRTTHRVGGQLVYRVCAGYLEVAMGTADALLQVQQGAAAHRWLAKGVQLADLLASEDPSLQLYRLVAREDLAGLMQRMNMCATQMMDIYPSFTVEELI